VCACVLQYTCTPAVAATGLLSVAVCVAVYSAVCIEVCVAVCVAVHTKIPAENKNAT